MTDSVPRITSVRAIPLQEGHSSQGVDTARNVYTLVVVETDATLCGVGSAYTSTDLVRAALGRIEDLLIGEVAIEPARVHEKLEGHGFWYGRGGSVTHAISGVDIALWDILGQATGQPVSRLLGGIYRDRVKPYASLSLGRDWIGDIERGLEAGFRAFKLGWGAFMRTGNPDDDERIVARAREMVGDADIMVDPGGSQQFWPHGFKSALTTADMLADYGVVWFEEPLPADDIEGYALLRKNSRGVMVSGGEVLTRRESFYPFFEAGAFDVVQPDCTKVGGLTEALHIAWAARRHNVLTVPHGWNTAIGLACDIHLVCALPVGKWVEYHQPSDVIDGLVTQPFQIDDGMLALPQGPGFGIELDWDAVGRLSGGRV